MPKLYAYGELEELMKLSRALADSVNDELQFVRDKHGVKNDEFACPYFQGMVKALRPLEAFLKDGK